MGLACRGGGVTHGPGVSGPPSPASQAVCDGESVLRGGKREGGREKSSGVSGYDGVAA